MILRVLPRVISFRAGLLAWALALLPVLIVAAVNGEFDPDLHYVDRAVAPLYVAPGVGDLQIDWTETAMQVAWHGVPAVTHLAVPEAGVSVFVYRDRAQFGTYLQRELDLATPPNLPPCFVDVIDLRRLVRCDASSFRSRGGAIWMMAHELTHHIIRDDTDTDRRLPAWYEEGLAEYVAAMVLAEHLRQTNYPTNGLAWRDWGTGADVLRQYPAMRLGSYERFIGGELTVGRHLLLATEWTSDRSYAESAIAIGWLVERFGMPAVIEVVRDAARSGSFEPAFTRAFGMTTFEFREKLEATIVRRRRSG